MLISPKRSNRVVLYLNDLEYMDLLRAADAYDKKPSEYVRFGVLRDMYGTLRMRQHRCNEIDSAIEAQDE
jgi:hypothetical protein